MATSKLTMKHKIGYALGDMGGCMTFALMGGFVTRYYVNILKIDPVLLATLLLIWNVWDAVNDPMMGTFMDKWYAKHPNPKGKFRPWLLRSAPLLAITAVAFWTVPTFFEGTSMLIVLFLCKILYEGLYTMFNIPMGSLLSAMANTDGERASLSAARGFGSMLGNVLPFMLFPLFLKAMGENNPKAYGIGAAVCAAIGFVLCMLHYYMTEERNFDATQTSADNIKFTDILNVFRVNRPFVALCLHGVCICTMQYVGATLGTYMYADVLGDIGLMPPVLHRGNAPEPDRSGGGTPHRQEAGPGEDDPLRPADRQRAVRHPVRCTYDDRCEPHRPRGVELSGHRLCKHLHCHAVGPGW